MKKRFLILVSILFILPTLIYAAVTDYLILQDIGSYKVFTTIFPEDFSGPPPKYSQTATGGILDAAGHFSENDVSYEASYTAPGSKWPFVKVEVTQHSGSDSDKWLLHEVERGSRRSKDLQATYGSPNPLREINGNRIWYTWGYYKWVSNNVVVYINFTDLTGTKPEPLEVVRAYLAKFPSTIPAITIDRAYNEKWLKDEMERRLWLCDKWFLQLQLQKAEQKTVINEAVKHMEVFLNYREKYYGIAALTEKQLLWGYRDKNNGTAIRNKLKEYKDWWTANKGGAINLP